VAHSNDHGGFQISRVGSSTNAVRSEPIGGRPSSLEVGPSGVWLGLDGVGLGINRSNRSQHDGRDVARPSRRARDRPGVGRRRIVGQRQRRLTAPNRSDNRRRYAHSLTGNGAIDWGSDGLWVTDITGSLVQLTSELERSGSSIDVGPNVVGINSGEGVVWLTQQRPDGTFA
jgi:hypothetical protein